MNIRVRYAPTLTVEQSPMLLLTHKTHRFGFPMVSSLGLQILDFGPSPPGSNYTLSPQALPLVGGWALGMS